MQKNTMRRPTEKETERIRNLLSKGRTYRYIVARVVEAGYSQEWAEMTVAYVQDCMSEAYDRHFS